MSESAFAFARLPSEPKLRILMYHTLEVAGPPSTRGRQSNVAFDALAALSHTSRLTYDSFYPSFSDIAKLYFAYESKAVHFNYFEKPFALLDSSQPDLSSRHPTTYFDHFIEGGAVPSSFLLLAKTIAMQDVWWLMYLAAISDRAQTMVRKLDRIFYPHFRDWSYYSVVDLFRFIEDRATFIPPHMGSLKSSRTDGLRRMLSYVGSCYAMNSYHEGLFPFHQLAKRYCKRVEDLKISWAHFVRCGAYAICIAHYLLGLQTDEIQCLFMGLYENEKYRANARGLPEDKRAHMLLMVSTCGDDVLLGPSCGTAAFDQDAFAERNRFWMISKNVDAVNVSHSRSSIDRTSGSATNTQRGQWRLNRDELIDDELIDGIDSLYEGELEELFSASGMRDEGQW